MIDPVTAFKRKVTSLKPGDVHVYHVGHLALGAASSPSLRNIQMFAWGLNLMGRVALRQRRVHNVIETLNGLPMADAWEYSFVVKQPIQSVDFETARKAGLEDYKAA